MKSSVVERIGRMLVAGYIFPDMAEKARDLLKEKLGKGEYETVSDVQDFARALSEARKLALEKIRSQTSRTLITSDLD